MFGGNFLHPFAIERQLMIAQLEETLKVPHKYRFPFFTEMMWWVLDRYCYHLLGRHQLDKGADVPVGGGERREDERELVVRELVDLELVGEVLDDGEWLRSCGYLR